MDSVWTISAQLPSFEPLHTDIKTDVLIIGGGLAGLLCAWRLKQACVDVALVEADTICSGITKNTAAKITSQHKVKDYRELENPCGNWVWKVITKNRNKKNLSRMENKAFLIER